MRTSGVDPTCAWVRDRLEEFVDGELGDAERIAVARHASACRDCARELGLSRCLRAELRALPVFALPPAAVERAEEAIARSLSERGAARGGWRAVAGRSLRAAGLATAAAALAMAAWLGWRGLARAPHAPGTSADAAAIEGAVRDLRLAFAYVDRYAVRTAVLVEAPVAGSLRRIRARRIDAIEEELTPWLRRALEESGLIATRSPGDRSS